MIVLFTLLRMNTNKYIIPIEDGVGVGKMIPLVSVMPDPMAIPKCMVANAVMQSRAVCIQQSADM